MAIQSATIVFQTPAVLVVQHERADARPIQVRDVTAPFSAFVFKVQANMDPAHRDRMAFVRVCSGRFTKDMAVSNLWTGQPVMHLTGWAADRFGTKRLYILAIVLFTAGSALCATANSLEMLVVFRVLQGLGASTVFVLVLFIGFCVIFGFTKTKRTAGGSANVVKSLDERIPSLARHEIIVAMARIAAVYASG